MVAAVANNLVDKIASLPGLPNRQHRQQVFARASEPTPLDPEALLADLNALAQPASRRDIGNQLAILVGCFPNAKTDDTEIYGRMLAEDVAARQPSVSDLEAACRGLRQSLNFRPSICEVLGALVAEQQERQRHTDRIERLIENERLKRQRQLEQQQQRQHELERRQQLLLERQQSVEDENAPF
jgi:hypothetical protein